MANWKKVAEALSQADQLTCGGLTARGGVCAVGQLFLAAGKTRNEIIEESRDEEYLKMFDGLLVREYDLNTNTVNLIWQANDKTDTYLSGEEVAACMTEWAGNQV